MALTPEDKLAVTETTGIIASVLGRYSVEEDGLYCLIDGDRVAEIKGSDTLLRLFVATIEHEKGHRE